MKTRFTRIVLLCLSSSVFVAADDRLAGHSAHGEAFNEGPRQQAVLLAGMADIDFPITTTNKQAQAFFDQGVSQLHGFWYFEAERSFRQALLIDTNCVMSYWGMAMANENNAERAKKLIDKTKDRQKHLTTRERDYIASLSSFYQDLKKDEKNRRRDLVRSLEQIVVDHPDDVNAKAFLVVLIWQNTRKGLPINSHLAVNALLDQIFEADPDHPAHHYRIHLWDYEREKRALKSAAACGPTAPGIAHMWHMPGHIYSRLHRYHDTVWHQEASARLDHANMIRTRIMPDRIHNYAHNNAWLSESMGFIGRAHDGIDLAANLVELPRRAAFETRPDGSERWTRKRTAYQQGQNRLFHDLPAYELWERALELNEAGYFEPFGDLPTETRRLHLVGLAHTHLGHKDRAASSLEELRTHLEALHAMRYREADLAELKAKDENKKPDEIDKAMLNALKAQRKHIQKAKEAITELETIARVFAGDGEKVLKDVQELKGVPKLRHANYLLRAGDTEKAMQFAQDEANHAKNHKEIMQAHVVDLLWRGDKKDEARKRFQDDLRPRSGLLDLDLPVVKRLAPIAKDLGLPADWRLEVEAFDDIAERPELDKLGPLHWHPYKAPTFALKDSQKKTVSLEAYAGKPLLLIFYLGSGCAHCMEQLNAFAPMGKAFEERGIPMVAISTDSVKGLKDTFEEIEGFGEGASKEMPFTILSDKSLKQFKAYRAFDDFEDEALHGTFLIDAQGLVRWQDISYEPFMNPDFVLEEAKRLFQLPAPELTSKN